MPKLHKPRHATLNPRPTTSAAPTPTGPNRQLATVKSLGVTIKEINIHNDKDIQLEKVELSWFYNMDFNSR